MGVFECTVAHDEATVALLDTLVADGDLAIDHRAVVGGLLRLVLTDDDISIVEAAGIAVTVGDDLEANAAMVADQTLPAGGITDALSTGFVTSYLDTAGIYAHFSALHAAFPGLTEWTDLPESSSGYDGSEPTALGASPVKLFRIRTPGPTKPGLLLITGIHAREWVPPLGAIEFVEQLLRNYDPASSDPDVQAVNALVEGLDIFVVPALNPDGINWSHHDYALWRKNRRPAPVGGCPGVDLNRNFGVYWGQPGSLPDSCQDIYRGPTAFSEPETRNIQVLCEAHPNIVIGVDCHSFGEVIYRPQPTGGTFISSEPVDPWDEAVYVQLEAAINAGVAEASPGKSYGTGTTSNHSGTSDEYLFFAHRIFGFDLECALSFQPSIASGITSAREVAAAMRALGAEALGFQATFSAPAAVVQVLDRSGSMVSSGYVDTTRANARRLVDLLSPNDAVGIVSFADGAATELALTPIAPGVAASARTAIDDIVFGGSTSIGAGLQLAGAALGAASSPRSIVLLSDGYQNFPPDVPTALAALPDDVRVYTIALGPASDTMLLASIAADTGGQFYFAPDALGLHEIYNFIRADLSTDGLVMNDSMDAGGGGGAGTDGFGANSARSGAGPAEREFVVDADAWELLISLSWDNPSVATDLVLVPPIGGELDLSRLRVDRGAGYVVGRIRRPHHGTWRLRVVAPTPTVCTAAAFVRSEIRLELPAAVRPGRPLRIRVRERARELRLAAGSATLHRASRNLRALAVASTPTPLYLRSAARADLDDDALQLQRVRHDLARRLGGDPLRYKTMGVSTALGKKRRRLSVALPESPGPSTLRIRVEGTSERTGKPFVRVGAVSVPSPRIRVSEPCAYLAGSQAQGKVRDA